LAPVAAVPVAPSAPPDSFDAQPVTPSAPPASYDINGDVLMAEAQVLPADWNAQMAEVVNIPMAEAIMLEPEGNFS
jgi:hypothetical protein